MTRIRSVMSSSFVSALSSIQISWGPTSTINRLRKWSRNSWQLWSKLLNLWLNYTTITLKLVPRTDQSSLSSNLDTWFLHYRCSNPPIFHLRRDRSCFKGDLVKIKYRRPPSVAFTWCKKLHSNNSSEARERSTSPNRITANSSIACSLSCNRCVNRTLRWYT